MGVEDAEERELRAMKIAHGINRCIWGLLSSIHQMQCEATQSKYKGDESKESFVCRCYYSNDYLK